jgi:hypothetical protein
MRARLSWSYFTYERAARLITGSTELPGWRAAHPSESAVLPARRPEQGDGQAPRPSAAD